MNTRVLAARVLTQVIGERRSLAVALPPALAQVGARERGLLQELCYGTLRWYPQLQGLLERLLDKPLKAREQEVRALLLMGLYQLLYLRVPDHAAVSEVVAATRKLGKSRAVGLVNAVLRNFQRQRGEWQVVLEHDVALHCAHPAWLLSALQADWPAQWQAIVQANNARPPQGLRVNLARLSRQAYLERLSAAGIDAVSAPFGCAGIYLAKPQEVENLFGFREGLISVQDPAAQLSVELLDLDTGFRILDACAAPGGKTCYILESTPGLNHLLALDSDAERLQRLRDNLKRLGLEAKLAVGDATAPQSWWDGQPYRRILVDAPCSGSGVIRRHPDIKLLRQPADIEPLAGRQYTLLARLWPLLAPGGMLVYATCSVLKRENECVAADFLAAHADAEERPIAADWGQAMRYGRQILPGEGGMDGFYYARFVKDA